MQSRPEDGIEMPLIFKFAPLPLFMFGLAVLLIPGLRSELPGLTAWIMLLPLLGVWMLFRMRKPLVAFDATHAEFQSTRLIGGRVRLRLPYIRSVVETPLQLSLAVSDASPQCQTREGFMRSVLLAAFAAVLTYISVSPTHAQIFSADEMDDLAVAEPVRVAVLGNFHLRQTPGAFNADTLAPVVKRLAAFEPTHVAVETVSAEHWRFLGTEPVRLQDMARMFGGHKKRVSEAASTVVDADPYEAAARLYTEEADLAPVTRMMLAARAGELPRAVALWMSLGATQQASFAEHAPELADELTRFSQSPDENYLIGSKLAAEFDPDAIAGMDDWSHADTFRKFGPAIGEIIENDPAISAGQEAINVVAEKVESDLTTPEAILEAYRFYNRDSEQSARARTEWGAFLAARSNPEAARARVAAMEVRNLRMAANIIELSEGRPGARVLVVTGVAHKPYLEAMLDRLAAVEIVSIEQLLAAP